MASGAEGEWQPQGNREGDRFKRLSYRRDRSNPPSGQEIEHSDQEGRPCSQMPAGLLPTV